MDIANLTTYGCFGDGAMYKLNKSADLSKVQRYVKFEDIVEASLNSPASPVQHARLKAKEESQVNNQKPPADRLRFQEKEQAATCKECGHKIDFSGMPPDMIALVLKGGICSDCIEKELEPVPGFPDLDDVLEYCRRSVSNKTLTDLDEHFIGTAWAYIEGKVRKLKPNLSKMDK